MTLTLQIIKREGGKAETLRANGQLPGVVYGPKQEATPIVMEARDFEKVYREAGESTIIKLNGLSEELDVLVHEIAFNPAKGGAIHVDFYAIEKGKELTTNVPLHFIGEAPAEKLGGVVTKVLHEVEVTCQPTALPSHIDVDVSALTDLESQISIADLTIPAGVKVEHEPEDMVATISTVAEEEETTGELDMSAIEVEKKGKGETEEAA